ncbi:AMP-binding protein [Pseudorhodobacter turbinis]|nr:AMP-binding protein [Pseudorhodobacter turbinis]
MASQSIRFKDAAWLPAHPGGVFQSLVDDLASHALQKPAEIAFRFLPDRGDAGATVWTWAKLDAQAWAVGQYLAQQGIGRGARVLLAYPTGLEFIAAFLGCLCIGAVPVPVSLPRPRERLSRWGHVSRDAGVSMILCSADDLDRLSAQAAEAGLAACHAPLAAGAGPIAFDRAAIGFQAGPEDLAFLQYTSGSTEAPRGVMITHGMLQANLAQIRAGFGFTALDRIVGWLPHYHDMGLIGGILTPVHLGISNTMMTPTSFLRDPLRYLQMVTRYEATVMGGPNFGYDHILRRATPEAIAGIDLSALRVAFSGAEPIRADTQQQFQQVFAGAGFTPCHWVGCYGLAEATLCVSVTPPAKLARHARLDAAALRQGRIAAGQDVTLPESGVATDPQEIAIVDSGTLQRAPADRVGEIWLRGPNVAKGYWKTGAPELFNQHLEGTGGWLRTGDLGFVQEGRLFVTGRLKELIILRGQNHYPQDLERSVADSDPAIAEGRVAAFEQVNGGLGILCELTRQACRDVQPDSVFSNIRNGLGQSHGLAPDRITLLRPAQLPVTPSGKIQRLACKAAQWQDAVAEWQANAVQNSAPAAPHGAFLTQLKSLPAPLRKGRLLSHLRKALAQATGNTDTVTDDGRFFEMGLDSVSAVSLIAALEQELALDLDATVIFEHSTPKALADHLLARLFRQQDTEQSSKTEDMRALRALLDPAQSPRRQE